MANGREKSGKWFAGVREKKANRADRADRVGKVVALFDFDGVIMDTEPQYTVFWNRQGKLHLGEEDFGPVSKDRL